jgi:hypothetical protein
MARCQQLSSLYSRHNTNGNARPLEVDAAVEDCRKGTYAAGDAALKRAQPLADPCSGDGVGALSVNVRRHDSRRRGACAFGYDERPSGALSSQRRAAWMVENVSSRRSTSAHPIHRPLGRTRPIAKTFFTIRYSTGTLGHLSTF